MSNKAINLLKCFALGAVMMCATACSGLQPMTPSQQGMEGQTAPSTRQSAQCDVSMYRDPRWGDVLRIMKDNNEYRGVVKCDPSGRILEYSRLEGLIQEDGLKTFFIFTPEGGDVSVVDDKNISHVFTANQKLWMEAVQTSNGATVQPKQPANKIGEEMYDETRDFAIRLFNEMIKTVNEQGIYKDKDFRTAPPREALKISGIDAQTASRLAAHLMAKPKPALLPA